MVGTKMQLLKANTQTKLRRILGDNPTVKTIEFFIENDRTNWTLTEIAGSSDLAYASLKLIVPKLLKTRLIKIDKTIGKAKLYRINRDSTIVKELYNLIGVINKNLHS